MKVDKLFHVLVVGGAMLSTGTTIANQSSVSETQPQTAGALAFCAPQSPKTCEQDADGNWVPKDGIECCWGTSCE